MRGGGGRRRFPKSSTVPDRAAAAAPPFDFSSSSIAGGGRRDSDVSLCSSRPSSAGGRPSASAAASLLLSDRHSQSAALRSLNSYLSSLPTPNPVSLRPPLPSARDIAEAFRLLLSRLDFPAGENPLDGDDLLAALRLLRYPLKLSRSALKAPGTPHAWPHLLSALHWLAQLARVADHLNSNPSAANFDAVNAPANDLLQYAAKSYTLFISGDDDAVAALDDEYLRKAEHQAANAAAAVDALAREAAELETKAKALKAGPSRREALERDKGMLVEDAKKFAVVVDSWGGKVAAMEAALRERERELEAKETEGRRTREENEELRRRVEAQAVNARDAERMRRELTVLDRDIAEAEAGRNALEEKAWELEADVGRKLKELELLAEVCNQAIKKLKLGNDFQYVLNVEGSTPAEVLGVNYKSTLKPALTALAEDTKKLSVSKLEEMIALQEQSRENAKMLEEKRARLAALQAKIDEAEARLNSLENEVRDQTSRCFAEGEKMKEEFSRKEQQLNIVEKDVEEFLKNSERKLQDALRETDEETQRCALDLVALIDAVSEHKEYMESTISGMKTDLCDAADVVASLSTKLVSNASIFSHCSLEQECTMSGEPLTDC